MVLELYKMAIKLNKWIIEYPHSEYLEIKGYHNKKYNEFFLILYDPFIDEELDHICWKGEEPYDQEECDA